MTDSPWVYTIDEFGLPFLFKFSSLDWFRPTQDGQLVECCVSGHIVYVKGAYLNNLKDMAK